LIEIFQGNVLNIPVTIMEDNKIKDLAGLQVRAGIKRMSDNVLFTVNCTVEGDTVLVPITSDITATLGLYVVEIQVYGNGYVETWGTFAFRVIDSVFV
jgi:hypothetical protein